ncbi:OmpA family protein [Dongia sp.]|uniref:OmpA family protein n=1 Tax=Dongia sp. TaxID=1977262 RepID=UPI0035AFD28B
MSKQAKAANCGKSAGFHRLLLAGAAAIGCLYLAPAAQAQQAYYLPQASSAPVTVNYGALSPYAAPGYGSPGVAAGFQPYGYAPGTGTSAAPKSVFTPYAQPVAVQPAYNQPVYGYAPAARTPFVAPYANPAFAPGGLAANRAGLPISTPTSNGMPQSYLNVPGAQQADAAPTKKKRKKKKAAAPAEMPATTPTATEEAAAAQVAAAEAVLESAPAQVAPTQATPTPAAEAPAEAPAAETQVAAAPEPVPAPTPPAEPESVPASVPSPAENAPAAAAAVAPATEQPAPEAAAETPAASTASEATSAAEAPTDQVASAEAPAETAPDTSGSAVLPAGGTRIVFEAGSDDLPQGATADLDALAEKMLGDQNLKVQVLAYSSGTPDAESQARRKALARGLEVRKYLIGKGVRSNRIDVRALGTKSEGNPADRVDIVPTAG